MLRLLALSLTATTVLSFAASDAGAMEQRTDKVSYPDEGVDLGTGWDSLEARKTHGSCIAFARNSRTPAQDSATQIRRVVDHYTFDEALDLSAEMEMQGFLGFGGSAKATYSKRSKIASDRTSFVLSAWVANSAEFIEARPGEPEIFLLPELAQLAVSNPGGFRRRCGDNFVSSIWRGAELLGMISFQSDSESERQVVTAELEASGFSFSGGGSFSQVMDRHRSGNQWNMTYFQSGGSGEPIPTNETAFINAAIGLRKSATLAPKGMWIAVRPYSDIKGWPSNGPAPDVSSDYDPLVARLAEAIRLYDDLGLVIENPAKFAVGFPKSMQDLRNWQDETQRNIAQYKLSLGNCVQRKIRTECGKPVDEAELQLGLLHSIDLPVPNRSVQDLYVDIGSPCIPWIKDEPCPPQPPPTVDSRYHPTAVANAIYRLRIEERSRGYCAMDRTHPYCLSNARKKEWRDYLFARLHLPAPGPLPITEAGEQTDVARPQVSPPRSRKRS